MDKRIFKTNAQWIVRLGAIEGINPSFSYWYFRTHSQAKRFVTEINKGVRPEMANYLAFNPRPK
jgi:hypothetical protein